MWDRMIIQSETDFRRERISKAIGRRRGSRSPDRTRIPFVGGSQQVNRRAR